MADDKLDDNFIEVDKRLRKLLRTAAIDTTIYAGTFLDADNPDNKDIDLSALSYLQVQVVDETPQFDDEAPDAAAEPPSYVDTESLLKKLQDSMAETSGESGPKLGQTQSISLQAQLLMDLQRLVAARATTRLERISRAFHRRGAMASPRGPLSRLKNLAEFKLTMGTRKD